jgi:hypothetical protein
MDLPNLLDRLQANDRFQVRNEGSIVVEEAIHAPGALEALLLWRA